MSDTDRDKFADIIQTLGGHIQAESDGFHFSLTEEEVHTLFFGYVQMSETIEGLVAVVEGFEADAKERAKKKIWRP